MEIKIYKRSNTTVLRVPWFTVATVEVPKIFRYQFICSHEPIRLINLATSQVIDKQLPAECSNHLWFGAIGRNRKGTGSDHAE